MELTLEQKNRIREIEEGEGKISKKNKVWLLGLGLKRCNKCKKVKEFEELCRDKSRKDGYKNKCKECDKEYYENNKEKRKEYYENNRGKIREYYENNKEKRKEYYENNKEKIREKRKEYRENNKEEIREKKKEYYENNKEKIREKKKEYYENNKEEIRENQKEYIRTQKARFIVFCSGAKKRNIRCELTYEQYKDIISPNSRCAYCDEPLEETECGLDRINNNHKIGYEIDNVVPCCRSCNFGKSDMDLREFIELCHMIMENHNNPYRDILRFDDKDYERFCRYKLKVAKMRAKKKKCEFNLSLSFAKNILKLPCFYCGRIMTPNRNHKHKSNWIGGLGFDKIDCSKGYIEDNVIQCCIDCNRLKYKSSQKEFSNRIDNICEKFPKALNEEEYIKILKGYANVSIPDVVQTKIQQNKRERMLGANEFRYIKN